MLLDKIQKENDIKNKYMKYIEKVSATYGDFYWFARHGRVLTGVSPEHAQIVGSV